MIIYTYGRKLDYKTYSDIWTFQRTKINNALIAL